MRFGVTNPSLIVYRCNDVINTIWWYNMFIVYYYKSKVDTSTWLIELCANFTWSFIVQSTYSKNSNLFALLTRQTLK